MSRSGNPMHTLWRCPWPGNPQSTNSGQEAAFPRPCVCPGAYTFWADGLISQVLEQRKTTPPPDLGYRCVFSGPGGGRLLFRWKGEKDSKDEMGRGRTPG